MAENNGDGGAQKQPSFRIKNLTVSLEVADKQYGDGNSGYTSITAYVDEANLEHIENVSLQVNPFRKQVRAFTDTCECRSKHLMTLLLQCPAYAFPAPTAMPCAMNQYVISHSQDAITYEGFLKCRCRCTLSPNQDRAISREQLERARNWQGTAAARNPARLRSRRK